MSLTTHTLGSATIVMGPWDYHHKPALREYLESPDIRTLVNQISHEVIIVLGGDGTLLQAIDQYRERDIPFLGINFGTRGYLLHPNEVAHSATHFIPMEYPMLKVTVQKNAQETHHYAFGDVYMKPENSLGACRYNLQMRWSDAQSSIDAVIGDGIIISTPAGSTGYTRNAGGPVLPPSSQDVVITHISPDRSRGLSPVVIPQSAEIIVTAIDTDRRPVVIATDGRKIAESGPDTISMSIKRATKSVKLLIADNFLQTWNTQALQELGYKS